MMKREPTVAIANMRENGCRGVLIYCLCGHSGEMNVDHWPDHATFGDIARELRCTKCGRAEPDVGPDWRPLVNNGVPR
jgi:hypothetical protein